MLTPSARRDFLLMVGAGLLSGCAAGTIPRPSLPRALKVIQTPTAVLLVDARSGAMIAAYTKATGGGILSVSNGLKYFWPNNISIDGPTNLGNGLTIMVKGSTTTWVGPNGNVGSASYDGANFTLVRPAVGTQVVRDPSPRITPQLSRGGPSRACQAATDALNSAFFAAMVAALAVELAPETIITEIAFLAAARAVADAQDAQTAACGGA